MSDPANLTIWDFALAWYQMPGVEADCLVAQDTYGLDVTALIFALYRARMGRDFDAGLAAELARSLSARVVEPLRGVRNAMKLLPSQIDRMASEALRQNIKSAELDAEKLVLNALTSLPFVQGFVTCEDAIMAIANVSLSTPTPTPDLEVLLKRLALAAQNM